MFDRKTRIAVLELVADRLRGDGFVLEKKKDRFIHRLATVVDIYQLVFLDGNRISPQVAVRVEEVERLFHLASDFEPKYQVDTPTVGSDIWRLMGKETYVQIASPEDLPAAVDTIVTMFKSVGLPYFEKYSNLLNIDNALNAAPDTPCEHRIMNYLRAATGVIVARLVGRKDYEELIVAYHNQMKRFAGGFYLSQYEKLLKVLADVPFGKDRE